MRTQRQHLEATARQREVLAFLVRFIEENGFPPSVREIATAIGVSSTFGVIRHLKALERKGRISRKRFTSRGIRVLEGKDDR